ncbi:cytochrome P450 CYP749A22-like [Cynara cardunculus var. scolymus]|uniref:cytochrome P450 CYP749A22-like n=1 Tax=Cynara cardunculus var. scolymus TaxID=59895 RepID=UPI000D626D26|nr:cytochrome P450 CYP749A22-like [Cynara cardunculus var. scolymus]
MATFLGIFIAILCSVTLLLLFKFLHKFWWIQMNIKRVLSPQGIHGPPYSFIHGNTKEISNMRKKSMSFPMDTSHYIFPRVQPHIDSWFRIYGKNFVYWHGPEAMLVVTEPVILKEIMSNREISMGKQDMGPIMKKIVGEGLISSEGDKWAKQRKIANHAFHAERLKNMVPAMVQSVDMMLTRWKEAGNEEMDVYEEFRILTSEVISRTAFGSSYEEGKQVFQKLGELTMIASKNSYRIRLPGFGKIFKDKDDVESDKLQAGIRDLIMQMISSREKTMDEDDSRNDYLGLLLKSHHDIHENFKLSTQDIIDDCKTFYAAGHGTVSLLLSWATLLLAIHTEWQEKAREEVRQVFGNENPTSEGIARLKTMGMIINETLRLYPPGIAITRRVGREMKVGNLNLPANINLQIPALALHHDPKIWGQEAHLFKPDRFSDGIVKATNDNPEAFLPFGYGPRNCVGSSFGINEAKTALSKILQRYRFCRSPNYVHAPLHRITLRPNSGVQIIFRAL